MSTSGNVQAVPGPAHGIAFGIASGLALLAASCSYDPGDPVVWARAAYRNSAAPVLRRGPGTAIADVASVEKRGDDWILSVFEGPTGHLLASRRVATSRTGSWPDVQALASGAAVFWFDGKGSRPMYWHWSEGSDQVEESSFLQKPAKGSAWDLVAIPGTGEVLLGVVLDGMLHLHAQEGDGPGVVELDAFQDATNPVGLHLEAVSYEGREDGGRWQVSLRAQTKEGPVAALVAIERSASGWTSVTVPGEPDEGPRFALIDGAIQESVAIVPYRIHPGELRGRDREVFRLAGHVSHWPCFGGPCVPIHTDTRTKKRRTYGLVQVISLESLETQLEFRVVQEYPAFHVVRTGFVREELGELLYWTCADGKLAVRRRTMGHESTQPGQR